MKPAALRDLLVVGAFAAACVGGLGYLAVNIGLELPGSTAYRIRADFAQANGVVPGDEVRVAGIRVGTVRAVSQGPDGSALTDLEIDGAVHLRSDVRAVVRPKSLLGTKYVEVVRRTGSSAPELHGGAVVPREQTGQAVEIDDVLNAMDPEARKAFSTILQQLGVGLDGRAGDVNSSLPAVDEAVTNLRPLARLGDRRQQEIGRILADLDVIMTALADEHESLGHIVDSGNAVYGAVARRDRQLAGTIQQAATTFGSLDAAFAGTTDANRSSLAMAPATNADAVHTLSLLNPAVDVLIPGILLGQVNYPSDQLNITEPESVHLAAEWISAFGQRDVNGTYSFRIVNVNNDPAEAPGKNSPRPAAAGTPGPSVSAGSPETPAPGARDPLCFLVGAPC